MNNLLENIDGIKLDQKIYDLKLRIQELKKLEEQKEELEGIRAIACWFWGLASKMRGESSAFKTEQVRREYAWLQKHPFVSLYKGVANSTRFLAGISKVDDEDTALNSRCNEIEEQLKTNGFIGRMNELLAGLQKNCAKGHGRPQKTVAA